LTSAVNFTKIRSRFTQKNEMQTKQRATKPKTTPRVRKSKLRTPKEARQWLRDNGITVTAFAEQNDLCRHALNDALRGLGKGNFGKSHAAAVALGIKHDPNSCTKPSKPARKSAAKSAAGKRA